MWHANNISSEDISKFIKHEKKLCITPTHTIGSPDKLCSIRLFKVS